MKKCMLNNTRLDRIRREVEYQAVIIDLAVNGAIDKEKAEGILGYKIPSTIRPLIKQESTEDDD